MNINSPQHVHYLRFSLVREWNLYRIEAINQSLARAIQESEYNNNKCIEKSNYQNYSINSLMLNMNKR